jgi:hypothetical protein
MERGWKRVGDREREKRKRGESRRRKKEREGGERERRAQGTKIASVGRVCGGLGRPLPQPCGG